MSRTYRDTTTIPARQRPFWKLTPIERMARGLCPYCGERDADNSHLVFGCNNGRAR